MTAAAAATLERHWLDETSWVDIGRDWLAGFEVDQREVFEAVRDGVQWQQPRVWRYDHHWEQPRVAASCRPGPNAPHPVITAAHKALRSHYRVEFMTTITMVHYRDGHDRMAAHRDGDLRFCDDTVIAVLTLGARRPWVLAPRRGAGLPFDVSPAGGDLLVMGGRAQQDWIHGVPPVNTLREGRISVQWRWTSRTGKPEVGGSSGAPRNYGGGR
jgi:alkylated DNA repair dioxygenase AlkB